MRNLDELRDDLVTLREGNAHEIEKGHPWTPFLALFQVQIDESIALIDRHRTDWPRSFAIDIGHLRAEPMAEVEDWLDEYAKGQRAIAWIVGGVFMVFANKADAVLFKLR